jgi:hypothetical protein
MIKRSNQWKWPLTILTKDTLEKKKDYDNACIFEVVKLNHHNGGVRNQSFHYTWKRPNKSLWNWHPLAHSCYIKQDIRLIFFQKEKKWKERKAIKTTGH